MSPTETSTPDERFEAIVAALAAHPDVTPPTEIAANKRFGTSAQLRVKNKIFAMLMQNHLVVKLPRQRVDELIASDAATRFAMGGGREMKEWASVAPESQADWLALAREAMAFVGSQA